MVRRTRGCLLRSVLVVVIIYFMDVADESNAAPLRLLPEDIKVGCYQLSPPPGWTNISPGPAAPLAGVSVTYFCAFTNKSVTIFCSSNVENFTETWNDTFSECSDNTAIQRTVVDYASVSECVILGGGAALIFIAVTIAAFVINEKLARHRRSHKVMVTSAPTLSEHVVTTEYVEMSENANSPRRPISLSPSSVFHHINPYEEITAALSSAPSNIDDGNTQNRTEEYIGNYVSSPTELSGSTLSSAQLDIDDSNTQNPTEQYIGKYVSSPTELSGSPLSSDPLEIDHHNTQNPPEEYIGNYVICPTELSESMLSSDPLDIDHHNTQNPSEEYIDNYVSCPTELSGSTLSSAPLDIDDRNMQNPVEEYIGNYVRCPTELSGSMLSSAPLDIDDRNTQNPVEKYIGNYVRCPTELSGSPLASDPLDIDHGNTQNPTVEFTCNYVNLISGSQNPLTYQPRYGRLIASPDSSVYSSLQNCDN